LKPISLGIAAAGLLRLLLSTRAYNACKGGATLLATHAFNVTGINGRVFPEVDYVRNWQVCIK